MKPGFKSVFESIQFQWVVTQSQLQRLERTLRELRVTALVMSLILVTIVVGLFGSAERAPAAVFRITISFGSLWWGMTYVATLLLPMLRGMVGRHYDAMPNIDFEQLEHELAPREQAKLLEASKYQVYRMRRIVQIATQLVAFGVLLTLISLSYSIMLGWGI